MSMTFIFLLTAFATLGTYICGAREDSRAWIVAGVVAPVMVLGAILGTPPLLA